MAQIHFYNSIPADMPMKFVVIAAKYRSKWILVQHKQRDTYEIPGGHIEDGEDYLSAAKRELFEETGAVECNLELVSVYTVTIDDVSTGGYLFFADVSTLSDLPDYEIEKIDFFDTLPKDLTYPHIQPQLFDYVQTWSKSQCSAGD